MYKVYRVIEIDGKLVDCYWGAWESEERANEVALELRDGTCFSTYVEKD